MIVPVTDEVSEAPLTIAQLPFFTSGRFPKPDLIGQCHEGGVTYTSGRELLERVRDLSLGLSSIGMGPGDRVALLSESRPDWVFADLAILTAGAITTPIYPTLAVDQVAFVLRDSEASLAIVSTLAQCAKVVAVAPTVPALRAIVVMDPLPPDAVSTSIPVLSFADVIARGHRKILDGWGVGRAFHDQAKNVRPSDIATIIYTSGTTAEPKGVMLTHGNLAANVAGVRAVLHADEADVGLSFLPLCHALERIVAYFYLTSGASIVFAESFDTIARDLVMVRPTLMSGVPRVFEKLHARVLAKGHAATGVTRLMFDWAARVAERSGGRFSRATD